MLIDPPIQDLIQKVDCRYTLAVEAAKRARQLMVGAQPLYETRETKPVSIAVEEIRRNLIVYERTDENDNE